MNCCDSSHTSESIWTSVSPHVPARAWLANAYALFKSWVQDQFYCSKLEVPACHLCHLPTAKAHLALAEESLDVVRLVLKHKATGAQCSPVVVQLQL